MYKRATALYPACASDGYELLRFGRILSPSPTLRTPAECSTWIRMTFAAGQEGYIDVSDSAIVKLSDADFSGFAGWQKISEGNTPFSADGLCDIDALKKIVKGVYEHQTREEAALKEGYKKEDVLAQYIKSNVSVREQLRGFICEAPSEWDNVHNEDRYRKLKDEGEFYHGNDAGYAAFLKLLESFQFWDKTGLPAGQKLWSFHPLEFVRHFRKCGWLSLDELTQLLPRRYGLNRAGATLSWETARGRLNGGTISHTDLCNAFRKYQFSTAERQVAFLSQAYIETGLMRTAREDGQGRGTSGNVQYYQAFYGRGLMQLTWPTLYDDYGKFRAFAPNTSGQYTDRRITQTSNHYWSGAPTVDSQGHTHRDTRRWYPRYDPELLVSIGSNACDSAGFFWVWKHFMGTTNILRIADAGITTETVGRMSILVNGGGNGYDDRQQYAAYLLRYRGDTTDTSTSATLTYARQKIVSRPRQTPTWGQSATISQVYVDFTPQRPA
ncbi:peptidase M23 [Burkholderia sp. SJ98]|uniref:peptidase M23 n=1 Tax=Caballeronia TaxID=1827195 RepID=UPI00025BC7BD|nr:MULTISPECIES: peptidase M23 [Caballeronia]EKS71218.1 peptidase M23 [Burkholderia sp. SJ98]